MKSKLMLHLSGKCFKVKLKVFLFVFITLLSCANFYPQDLQPKTNPFQGGIVFGLGGGITYPQTDYQIVKVGFAASGEGEYFFNTHSIHLPGLKLKIGYDQLTGEDTRGTISSPDAEDGRREISPTFSTNIFSVGIAATYCISINDVVFPYVSGGISNLWFDPKDDQGNPGAYNAAGKYKKSTVAYTLEVGLKVLISDKVSLNFSANPYFPQSDYLDDVAAAYINDSYTTLMAGITFTPFYNNDRDGDGVADAIDNCLDTPAGVKVDEFGCPMDTDKDGVPDYLDKCPDTPIGIAVDQNGCPLDSDGDGVADAIDNCPDTPAGVKVDEFGCPVDTDKDGVPDYLDKCPDTPEGIMVDQKGCPVNETKLEKFLLAADDIFSPNSSTIKVEGKKYLDEVVMQLKKFPDKKWRIEGYMDSNGGVRYLRNLSLERAKVVLEYFTNIGGLKRENFQVFGMGENSPVADNSTEKGRMQNRRIEIIPEGVTDSIASKNVDNEEETFNQFILRADDTFKPNSTTLTDLAKFMLDEIASYIKNQPESKWKIEGHTDNQGSVSELNKLSYDWANSVYEYLISKGLSPSQFTVSGFGSELPIGDNNTVEGRSTNRRVLIIREN